MASQSAHFNLTKPATTDYYNLGVINANTDIIDQQMYNNQQSAAKIMVGASANEDGESGRVPQPNAGDEDKYLKADGTWDTPSGGGGSSTLSGLTDVDLSSPTNGQVLKYNSATQKWENAYESGGSSAEEITLDEYNALTTDQKNDGTIRFIPNGSTISSTTTIDMSSISSKMESAMNVSSTSDQITVSWDGGMQIGGTFYYATPIDVTSWDKIGFDLTTSSCYGGGSSAQQARWNVQIGLQASAPSSVQVIDATDSRWAAVVDYANANTVYSNQELDISELTGQYYLVINAHGWNAIIDDFVLEKIGFTYPSQIRYMDKTYGIGSGSESDITIVSRTDNTNGYAWLIPCDANGNPLKPSEVTLLSIFAEADMSGAPPYYNGLNVCVDTDSDRYLCKLYNTQGGSYAQDGVYSVDYTVAYISNSGGSSGGENTRFESTELLSSTISTGGTYTLEDALENYDFVTIVSGASHESDIRTVAVEDILNTLSDGIIVNLIGASDRWVNITACSGTSITIAMNAPYIHSIKGYKFVGGGSSSLHTYSTTEQKVGTWIDGSDVWEKTINIEETTIHDNASFTIDIETNIDVLIEYSLMYRDAGLQNGRWNPLDNVTDQISYDMYSNRLYMESNGTLTGEFAGSSGVVTICGVIRYTKVTTS